MSPSTNHWWPLFALTVFVFIWNKSQLFVQNCFLLKCHCFFVCFVILIQVKLTYKDTPFDVQIIIIEWICKLIVMSFDDYWLLPLRRVGNSNLRLLQLCFRVINYWVIVACEPCLLPGSDHIAAEKVGRRPFSLWLGVRASWMMI